MHWISYLWRVIIVADHIHWCTCITKCITIHKSESLVFAIYMHQVYLWCVLYVFCVLYGSRCEIQFYLIFWLQTIIRFPQSEIYIYVVQFIFNFELKYNEIAAVYMYIYCIYKWHCQIIYFTANKSWTNFKLYFVVFLG